MRDKNMKKIFAILFCFLFLLTACSGKEDNPSSTFNESNAVSYVGAGEMTAINILVNSNKLLSEVFVNGHLPVDESGLIENKQGTFAPVASVEITTYAALKEMVYSTYTTETAEKLLNEPAKYVEINGKLYFDMQYDTQEQGNAAAEVPEISAEISADGKYVVSVKYGSEETVMSAVETDEGIRLENIY